MNGAQFIAEILRKEGVDKVFGQCGHTNYALIDALQKVGIDFVSFRHEQMAAHAADGYFRASHRLAVVLVHLSPGLTNALTGVVTAAADCTPMLVISGNTPSYHHPRDAHQCIRFHSDASQGDIYRPVCKRVWRVDDARHLPDVMSRALNTAQTGRPGAVLVDVPMDVLAQPVDGVVPDPAVRRAGHARPPADEAAIEQAAKLLVSAKRPVIFAGGGVLLAEAWQELRDLAELLQIPVATSLMGKGAFPEDHPLSVGVTGIWGTKVANETTREADVILAVGTGFAEADCSSWRVEHTFAIPPTRLIQIDLDPQEIGKIYPADVGIVADARRSLRQLVDAIRDQRDQAPDPAERLALLAERKARWQAELDQSQLDDGVPIHPARVLRELRSIAPPDAVFVTDVGWNKNGAGQQLPSRQPMTFITSGGMATMGFSPAAAIGAKLARPDRKVLGLVGDGGFTSVLGAVATAVELDVAVVWVLFNNYCFSTITCMGETYFANRYGTEFRRRDGSPYNPDFQGLARAFGIDGYLVTEPDQLAPVLKEALGRDRCALVEVRTRGDVPMPRTGYWDIAEILSAGSGT
ncbi:MAG: thiamine pyrophosphate-binding protein [Firmicutes bacterium]|nr:thiamine pyrophosphate-binding protein [Bacillota bacterium]